MNQSAQYKFLVCILFSFFIFWSPIRANAATYTVDSVADTNLTTCSGAANDCTLRGAINAVNSACGSGPHTIAFGVPGVSVGAVATINVTSALPLPSMDCAGTIVDGTAQTAVSDTLTGTLGAGGTVGTDGLSLSAVNRPEVQIIEGLTGPTFHEYGLRVNADNITIQGIAIYGFGNGENIFSDNDANIYNNGKAGLTIQHNIIGTSASAFTDPGSSVRTRGANFISQDGDNGTFRNNLVGYANASGIALMFGASSWTVTNNEVRANGQLPVSAAVADGIDMPVDSSNNSITRNLVINNRANGIDMYQNTVPTTTTNTLTNNTIINNGLGEYETAGIRIYSSGNTVNKNIITSNFGAGVMVRYGVTSNTISQNSMFNNGEITGDQGGSASGQVAIDLLSTSDSDIKGTSPFRTLNDNSDTDTGGNGLFNFPVITSAQIDGSNLVIKGFARPGSVIELFIADQDPSGFGEGVTYLTSLTEGGGSDTDTSTGSYSGSINGFNQGTDTTNRFTFTFSKPSNVNANTPLTATATLSNITSEFGAYALASNSGSSGTGQEIGGAKRAENLHDVDNSEYDHEVTYVVKIENTGSGILSNVQATEDLTDVFSKFKVTSISSSNFTVNTNFDGDNNKNLLAGTDTLGASASGELSFNVRFKADSDKAEYENRVDVYGTTTDNVTLHDITTDGVNVDPDTNGDPGDDDEPTVIDLGKDPKIGAAKHLISLTKNENGTFDTEYEFVIKNMGNVDLYNVNASEDLVSTFGLSPTNKKYRIIALPQSNCEGVANCDELDTNGNFDGATNNDLLKGKEVLKAGRQTRITLKINFTPTKNKYLYENFITAEGYTKDNQGGEKVTDKSQDSSRLDPDPDDDENPTNNNVKTVINIDPAKSLVSVGTNLTYNFVFGALFVAIGLTILFILSIKKSPIK